MLKRLESKQGLRAGQLFQLSGLHDEKQQQPSGNMQESGNCLMSYDSCCQISCPIRFLQRESLEQVEYFSYLCSIKAQLSGDAQVWHHWQISHSNKWSQDGQRGGAWSRWIASIIWAPWWIRTSTAISRSVAGRQTITALLWHNFKIWCGWSISAAVKLRFVLALAWPMTTSSAEGRTLRKLFVSASRFFVVFHSLFVHCRENTDSAPSLLLAPFDFIVFQELVEEN